MGQGRASGSVLLPQHRGIGASVRRHRKRLLELQSVQLTRTAWQRTIASRSGSTISRHVTHDMHCKTNTTVSACCEVSCTKQYDDAPVVVTGATPAIRDNSRLRPSNATAAAAGQADLCCTCPCRTTATTVLQWDTPLAVPEVSQVWCAVGPSSPPPALPSFRLQSKQSATSHKLTMVRPLAQP